VKFAGREAEEAERLKGLLQKGKEALGVMEKYLQERPYMAGGAFSVADIALYAYTHVAPDGGFDLDSFKEVRAWLSRIESVPGFVDMAEACC